MRKTPILDIGGLQTICLSGDLKFPDRVREVVLFREGKRRVIVPVNAVWDDFFDALGIDIGERAQPVAQERDLF